MSPHEAAFNKFIETKGVLIRDVPIAAAAYIYAIAWAEGRFDLLDEQIARHMKEAQRIADEPSRRRVDCPTNYVVAR